MRTKLYPLFMILFLAMAGIVPTTIALTTPSGDNDNVIVNPNNTTYPVRGSCCCQAAANLEDPSGSTEPHFSISYEAAPRATPVEVEEEEPEEKEFQVDDPIPGKKIKYKGPAEVTSVTVTVDITVRMPEAESASDFPPSCQTAWTAFINALQAHEDAHVEDIKEIAHGSLKEEADSMVGTKVTAPGLYDTAAEAMQKAMELLETEMQKKITTAVENADKAWEESAEELHKEIGETVDLTICEYCQNGHQ